MLEGFHEVAIDRAMGEPDVKSKNLADGADAAIVFKRRFRLFGQLSSPVARCGPVLRDCGRAVQYARYPLSRARAQA